MYLFTGEAAEEEWSIDEATGKFQASVEKSHWKFTFNEKVDFSEDIFKENYREKIPEEYTEYATRYDLTFLSPCSYQIRCKVNIEYFMESARARCLHTSCGVSEIEQVSEARFLIQNNEYINTVQSTFHVVLCLLYTY